LAPSMAFLEDSLSYFLLRNNSNESAYLQALNSRGSSLIQNLGTRS